MSENKNKETEKEVIKDEVLADMYIKYFNDVRRDNHWIIKGLISIAVTSICAIILLTIIFMNNIKTQRQEFMETINRQQTEFINFLSEYDFIYYDIEMNSENIDHSEIKAISGIRE